MCGAPLRLPPGRALMPLSLLPLLLLGLTASPAVAQDGGEDGLEEDGFDLEDELSISSEAAYDWHSPLAKQVAEDFERHKEEEGLEDLLTPDEMERYKTRFMASAKSKATAMDISDTTDASEHAAKWQASVKSSLVNEMPLVTEKLAEKVNGKNLGWSAKAGEWAKDLSVGDAKDLLGFVQNEEIETTKPEHFTEEVRYLRAFPTSFDSRKQWPMCAEQINHVRNQGKCGSCWAQATAQSLDGRLCIASGGKFSGPNAWISEGYITACYSMPTINGCVGGNPGWAMSRMKATFVPGMGGAPTGEATGCVPYFGSGDSLQHFSGKNIKAPDCPRYCRSGYPRALDRDKFYPTSTPSTSKNLVDAKRALMEGGPIVMAFQVYQDFMAYRSGYYDRSVSKQVGGHATTLIGWEKEEYLISTNSWGRKWGDHGMFKMRASCCNVAYFMTQVSGGRPQSLPLPDSAVLAQPAPARGPSRASKARAAFSKFGNMFRGFDIQGEDNSTEESGGPDTTNVTAEAEKAGVETRSTDVVLVVDSLKCSALNDDAKRQLVKSASLALVGKLAMLLPDAIVQDSGGMPDRVSILPCGKSLLAADHKWECVGRSEGSNVTGIAFTIVLPASQVAELDSASGKASESRAAVEHRIAEAMGWKAPIIGRCLTTGSGRHPADGTLDASAASDFAADTAARPAHLQPGANGDGAEGAASPERAWLFIFTGCFVMLIGAALAAASCRSSKGIREESSDSESSVEGAVRPAGSGAARTLQAAE